MNLFDYTRPETVAGAVAAASRPGAAYLAGGTNLLDLMKAGVSQPQILVDISRIAGLDGIDWNEDGSVRIGALVRNADLAGNPAFSGSFPAIAEALLSGASGQLRNAATVGGNLMQQTRCLYFYDRHSACNRRKPGTGCDAIGGETTGHAVLGWTDQCIATHPSDFCVPLMALDAEIEIEGPDGQRLITADAFFRLPDAGFAGGPCIGTGDLITAVRLPASARQFAANARYLKLRDRTSYAFALVSAAAMMMVRDGMIEDVRIALGGVAAKPWRAHEGEAELKGRPVSAASFAAAADAALSGAAPSGDNGHKVELARRLVRRALDSALKGTPAGMPALPGSVFSAQQAAG